MKLLPPKEKRTTLHRLLTSLLFLIIICSSIYLFHLQEKLRQEMEQISLGLDQNLSSQQESLRTEIAYEAHLSSLNSFAIEQGKQKIEQNYETLLSEATQEKQAQIESVFNLYEEALKRIERNKTEGLDTTETENEIPQWGEEFLNQNFTTLEETITEKNSSLDSDYQNLLEERATAERARQQAIPTATPIPVQQSLPSTLTKGYGYLQVQTSRGTFYAFVVKYPLSEVRVLTVSTNTQDCTDNCPAQSLQTYIEQNNGFAGIHGSYFCPPDYASCAGKTYSYDYALYNSKEGKWLNQQSIGWTNVGLMTFQETQTNLINFYQFVPNYPAPSVTAGIENFPSLVEGGNIIVQNFNLTAYQNLQGYRGAIGYDSSHVYLVISPGASVTDMAYIMQKIGATHALNLDGGGSSALYHQGYKVGPGRLLPNAIVLQKR